MDHMKCPRSSTLLQYVDDLLPYSPFQTPQRGEHPLSKALSFKVHNVTKEKSYALDPDRLHGVLSVLKLKTKCQLQGFLELVGYC